MRKILLSAAVIGLLSPLKISQAQNTEGNLTYLELREEVAFSHLNAEKLIQKQTNSFHANGKWMLIQSLEDELGMSHHKYQLFIHQLPVEHNVYSVHVKDGRIISLNGYITPSTPNTTTPSISESDALGSALNQLNAKAYKWEDEQAERHLKWEQNNPNATYFPTGELSFIEHDGALRLAYKFDIYATTPLFRREVFVDAATSKIIFQNELLCHVNVNGTAVTKYSGNQTITTDSLGPNNFILEDYTRGQGVRTWDMNEGTNHGNAVSFTDADNYWNNANAAQDEVAADAHWGAMMTYDYFLSEHNRNSIDGNGFQLNSYVHYDVAYANAFWDGFRMTYGDGNSSMSALTTMDIAAHEITHGLTTNSANLIYQNESGALNESFSDIFGAAVEFYAKPTTANWLIGDETGNAIRSMSNPNSFGDPDCYFGNSWYTGAGDNGGVHINSGVQNFWFYLLVNGGSGTNDLGDSYTVNSIGMTKAAKIAFRNLTVYLGQQSQYADARTFAIQSAVDLYGSCSPEVEAVTNAWYACGVGAAYVPYTVADFAGDITESCSAPHQVNFANNSINGTTYSWSFGDGNTSTAMSPSNTYTSNGSYDVTLIVDGGVCGIDTLVLPNHVVISDTLPCIVTMQSNGVSPTQTSCSGRILDSGGNQNYADNTMDQITISPAGASSVTLTFNLFDIEPGQGTTCNYDYLEIFDGPSVNSPSLGRFCNTTGNPGTIVSSGGSLTLVLSSDQAVSHAGFDISYECTQITMPPEANFSYTPEETCFGEVHFSDLTTNGASSWLWDFGDGNTSTDQNPVHTYAMSGNYTVSLTATNSFGTDQAIVSNAITVNRFTNPGVTDLGNHWISGNGSGTNLWHLDYTDDYIAKGDSFQFTGSTDSIYYISESPVSILNTGALDNNIGTGNNFNNLQGLNFNALSDFRLHSVKVYAGNEGDRTIEVQDDNGDVVVSKTVYIPSGESRVNLDFNIPQGMGYTLTLNSNSMVSLYRNNSGPNYPYFVNGLVQITSSTANTDPLGYYYFFYDWEVSTIPCKSEPLLVRKGAVSVEEIADNQFELYPNPTQNGINIVSNEGAIDAVYIYDVAGKLIFQQKVNAVKSVIDLTGLANGVYQVNIHQNGNYVTKKLIKQ